MGAEVRKVPEPAPSGRSGKDGCMRYWSSSRGMGAGTMRVLLAVNGNESSEPTVEAMSRWAALVAGEVLLFDVFADNGIAACSEDDGPTAARLRLEHEGYLKRVGASYLLQATVTTCVEATSEVARSIIAAATKGGCDLIALGGSWPDDGVGEPVEEVVVRLAPVPVVLIGPGALA